MDKSDQNDMQKNSYADPFRANHTVQTGVCALLAIACTFFSRYAVPFSFQYSISLWPLVVAVLLFFLFRNRHLYTMQALRGCVRYTVTAVITSLIFASFLVIGSWSACEDDSSFTVLNVAAIFFVSIPLLVGFIWLMDWLDDRAKAIQFRRESESATPKQMDRRWVIGVFAILLLCWLPVFLAAYPGFFCYDMAAGDHPEIAQWLNNEFNDHQPLLHTLLIGSFVQMSIDLTGGANEGIAVFVVFQALIIAAIFTFMVMQIYHAAVPHCVSIASTAYLALDPLISMFVNCTVKDTLFSACVVLLITLLFSRSSAKTLRGDLWYWIAVAISALGVCLFRVNGIFAFVIVVPFIIFAMAKGVERKRSLITSVFVLAISICWFGPIAAALNVQSSDMQKYNATALPSQQIAYTVKEQGSAMKITDRDMLIEKEYGRVEDGMRKIQYYPACADAARYNLEGMTIPDILSIWVTLGVSYPKEYAKALVYQTEGAWNPYANIKVYETGNYEDRETSLFEFNWEKPATSQSLFPAFVEPLRMLSTDLTLQNIPLLSLLTSVPFYVWTMILLLARTVITRDRRLYAPIALLTVLTLTALLGPCVLVRYYLYLVFGLPVMVAMLLISLPQTQPKASRIS